MDTFYDEASESADGGRFMHLAEIIGMEYPSDDFEYKLRVLIVNDDDPEVFQRDLTVRSLPVWMVNLKHQESSYVTLTLCYRPSGSEESWQEVAPFSFQTAEVLNAVVSANVSIAPSEPWELAPKMKLKLRIVSSLDLQRVREAALPEHLPEDLKNRPDLETLVADGGDLRDLIPETAELNAQDQVIVKDTWNKLLGWKDLTMPTFFERLLAIEPELIDIFGAAIENVCEEFFGLFDLQIRSQQPHTENILREAYRGVHPSSEYEANTVEGYGKFFADLGMRPHHWNTVRDAFLWTIPLIPYIEDYEKKDLQEKGENSAVYRFYEIFIRRPMLLAIQEHDSHLTAEALSSMQEAWDQLRDKKDLVGAAFYHQLFQRHPEALPLFGRMDLDRFAGRAFESLPDTLYAMHNWDTLVPEISELPDLSEFPESPYPWMRDALLATLENHLPEFAEPQQDAWKELLSRSRNVYKQRRKRQTYVYDKAKEYVEKVGHEHGWHPRDVTRRLREIRDEIEATGTYTHTYEELGYGAQMAWRNSPKCVGRMAWKNLMVRDMRHVHHPDDMFEEIREHMRMATNEGKLQAAISIFRATKPGERWGPKIWNVQLARYAAYVEEDGRVIGDRANIDLTEAIQKLGWTPPSPRSQFDILPLVIDVPGHSPQMYEFPREEMLEVEIEHPDKPQLALLGLKWYAVPAIAGFRLEIGGVSYGCLPFNGWYLVTEVARDFTDEYRYDKLEEIAKVLNLETKSLATMWKDEAFLHLNKAILHSFQKNKVTMVDQHNVARQFMTHDMREKKAGRETPAQWSWVIPPLGGTTIPIFHHEMRDFLVEPQYYYYAEKWAVEEDNQVDALTGGEVFLGDDLIHSNQEEGVLVLFGSETGNAEHFAHLTAKRFQRFRARVKALDQFPVDDLEHEKLVLIVVSTTGDGALPINAQNFFAWLTEQDDPELLQKMKYSILALGSTLRSSYGAAGETIDAELQRLGAQPFLGLRKADALRGLGADFERWLGLVARTFGEDAGAGDSVAPPPARQLVVNYMEEHDAAEEMPTAGVTAFPKAPARVVANDELLGADDRSAHLLTIDVAEAGVFFGVGDHLAVYPPNPPELVDRMIERLGVEPDIWITAEYVDSFGDGHRDDVPFLQPMTIHQLLSDELDLSLRDPLPLMLESLCAYASEPADREKLSDWINGLRLPENNPARRETEASLRAECPTLVDLLEALPSVFVELHHLIELLPRIEPRYYAVASAPAQSPTDLQIVVSPMSWDEGGAERRGLCSNYLAGLQPDDLVQVSTRETFFVPPEDLAAPLLMVGAGVSVAPYRAFLQQRAAQLLESGGGAGAARLIYGTRDEASTLFREELEGWRNDGVLSELDLAFSRQDDDKSYVQDLIRQKPEEVWEMLQDVSCNVYLAGDARMIDEVTEALRDVACLAGKMTRLEAIAFFSAMRDEGRLHVDVWGVMLHHASSIEALRTARYSLAETWFRQVDRQESENPSFAMAGF